MFHNEFVTCRVKFHRECVICTRVEIQRVFQSDFVEDLQSEVSKCVFKVRLNETCRVN